MKVFVIQHITTHNRPDTPGITEHQEAVHEKQPEFVYVCTDEGHACTGEDVYSTSKGLCRAKDINHIP